MRKPLRERELEKELNIHKNNLDVMRSAIRPFLDKVETAGERLNKSRVSAVTQKCFKEEVDSDDKPYYIYRKIVGYEKPFIKIVEFSTYDKYGTFELAVKARPVLILDDIPRYLGKLTSNLNFKNELKKWCNQIEFEGK